MRRAAPIAPAWLALLLTAATGVSLLTATGASAETGEDAWLRYAALPAEIAARFRAVPAELVTLGDALEIASARDELTRGLRGLLGRVPAVTARPGSAPAVIVGTLSDMRRAVPGADLPAELAPDAYHLQQLPPASGGHLVVAGGDARGALYGTFALLRRIALGRELQGLRESAAPYAPERWVNHWDNLDGTIERGYAGRSIFFEGGRVRDDLSRAREYARLLASVGIEACAINNVNADVRVMSDAFLPDLARVADAFRPWGVRLAIAVDFSSPRKLGGLDTFDPLDPAVARFWEERVNAIYKAVPDLAGFVLKADSEGRLGPSAYGRTHADAANVIARPLQQHGGLLFYRGFVYDHKMDWRNLKNDRAKAAYDNFASLDGAFLDNVIIQIKHGPIDFQVREPASPLFGALERTNQAIELQITQEYLGQQRHIVYLPTMWQEVLDFDMHARGAGTPVKALVAGRTFNRPTGGFVGVSNVGRDANWLGHHLAQSNLYGFGRLAFDPDLSAEAIAEEWVRQTFGHDPVVVKTVTGMLMDSWRIYEQYTGPLGAGTLTDIIGVHFGPGVESSERNGWGQWHRADAHGIGMNRTVATGTGYIGQYRPPVARMYESLETCPDELLLFMHHVPYTHVLHSGKTVIQHIYDEHYAGAEAADGLVARWRTLEGRIDDERFRHVLDRLEFQAGHARVWRDAVNSWFLKTSGIPDAQGRAGHFPNRTEAEAMTLEGFAPADVTPWETASGGKSVECSPAGRRCAARFIHRGGAGRHTVMVHYFDQDDGTSRFRLLVGGRELASWAADGDVPRSDSNGHTATWFRLRGVDLRPGDEIVVEAVADGEEPAPLDYVEVEPEGAAGTR